MTHATLLKKCIIHGIQSGVISFFLIMILNLSIFNKDNLGNFITIIIISVINSYLIGISTFISCYAHHMTHLKHIAMVVIILTIAVFSFLEYPIVEHLVLSDDPDINIGFGKIIHINTTESIPNEGIEISIG